MLGDAVLAEAVRNGVLTPPVLAPGPPPEAAPVAPLDQILSELGADRADR